ncbi:OXA1 [Symbiodinium microadriaticum]|nr:OXA1 [Symbiodinium microadriaticum]CAE7823795.1 OXA1 [Symbiodinium sp. KB8]
MIQQSDERARVLGRDCRERYGGPKQWQIKPRGEGFADCRHFMAELDVGPAPCTPPRRRPWHRACSSEKLVDTRKAPRARTEAPAMASIHDSPSAGSEEVTSAADCLWQRHHGDAKYWVQIRSAQRLLMRSIGTELVLNEASLRGPEVVLEPLLREAIDAQEADRMSAITMLGILNELVTRLDGEALDQHHFRGQPMAECEATPPRVSKRARDDLWTEESTASSTPAEPPQIFLSRSAGDGTGATPTSADSEDLPETPAPQTPPRRSGDSRGKTLLAPIPLETPPKPERRSRPRLLTPGDDKDCLHSQSYIVRWLVAAIELPWEGFRAAPVQHARALGMAAFAEASRACARLVALLWFRRLRGTERQVIHVVVPVDRSPADVKWRTSTMPSLLRPSSARLCLRASPRVPLGISPARDGRNVRFISAGPVRAQLAMSGYPEDSMSRNLLDKCLEASVARGTDVSSEYHPWLPVDLLQTLMIDIHDYAGCSWFAAIIATCFGIRLIALPVSISAIRGTREKALLQPKYEELMAKQKETEGDPVKAQEAQKKVQAFTQKHGKLFMMKGTWNLFLFQMPLYITAFAAMRGMANHPDVFRGFAMEAPLWLDSLALSDPYYLMPILTSAIMMTNTELYGSVDTEAVPTATGPGQDSGSALGQNTMQKYQKYVMRGSALMFIPFTSGFPSGVFVFMCTNMVLAAVQNRVLRNPALERWLELPPKKSKDSKESQLVGPSPWPPALVPLGLSLERPRNALLGTPQIIKPKPWVEPPPHARLENIPSLSPARVEAREIDKLLPCAKAQFAVRRARRSDSLPSDA